MKRTTRLAQTRLADRPQNMRNLVGVKYMCVLLRHALLLLFQAVERQPVFISRAAFDDIAYVHQKFERYFGGLLFFAVFVEQVLIK